MCERFRLFHTPEEIAERFGADEALGIEARHNVAPTQNVPVVTQNGARHLSHYHWGLIPSFRTALIRRCLIPADGFYKWQAAQAALQGIRHRCICIAKTAAYWRLRAGDAVVLKMNIHQKPAKLAACSALLVLAAPLAADTPKTVTANPTVQPVLDKLIGKRQVIGLTEHGGSRYLGRILSGDHGLYLIQTFHYVSAPVAVPVTTLQSGMGTGRNRRPSQETKKVTTRITTQNVIPDDQAVQALLSGVTGALYRPHEEAGPRKMVAPTDVLCLQELSPPASPSVAAGWTMKTLWASPDLPASAAQSDKQSKK